MENCPANKLFDSQLKWYCWLKLRLRTWQSSQVPNPPSLQRFQFGVLVGAKPKICW